MKVCEKPARIQTVAVAGGGESQDEVSLREETHLRQQGPQPAAAAATTTTVCFHLHISRVSVSVSCVLSSGRAREEKGLDGLIKNQPEVRVREGRGAAVAGSPGGRYHESTLQD